MIGLPEIVGYLGHGDSSVHGVLPGIFSALLALLFIVFLLQYYL